jgi:hypothetical protein
MWKRRLVKVFAMVAGLCHREKAERWYASVEYLDVQLDVGGAKKPESAAVASKGNRHSGARGLVGFCPTGLDLEPSLVETELRRAGSAGSRAEERVIEIYEWSRELLI